MSQFQRGISAKFVERLNAEYRKGGWWQTIADDRDLFIAIRKDYINVYLNGSSLLKLWLEGDELVGETHYKYLLVPEARRPYVKVVGGQVLIESHADLFQSDLSNLQAEIEATQEELARQEALVSRQQQNLSAIEEARRALDAI